MAEPKNTIDSLREWVVDHKLRTVGCLWLSGIVGSIAYNWSQPHMKTSVKIIHARNLAMKKSSKDTRYAVDAVVTHDGTKNPSWALLNLMLFRHKFGAELSSPTASRMLLLLSSFRVALELLFDDLFFMSRKTEPPDPQLLKLVKFRSWVTA